MKPIKVNSNNTIEREPLRRQYLFKEDKQVIIDFERMVKQFYGFHRGIISVEIIKAFKLYMASLDFECYSDIPTDTLIKKDHAHKPLLLDGKKLLAGYVCDNFYLGDRITFRELQDIIINEYGRSDKRTHKSYVDTLEVHDILVRCDNVERYDYYYFKEVPLLGPVDNLNEDQTKVYGFIPDEGVIRMEKLERISGWSHEKLAKNLEQLENDGLIERPTPGVFKIIKEEG
jgi:hypothetical protein